MILNNDHIEYPELTMFQMVERVAKKYPNAYCMELFGKKTKYKDFLAKIEQAARAFCAEGIRMGDRVTICMPNIPQAMVCFYALNRIGAIANMIHPLSAQDEITFYLNFSKSKMIMTVDMFYEKVEAALKQTDHPVTIVMTRVQEELPLPLAAAMNVKNAKKLGRFPNTDHAITWKAFLKKGTPQIRLTDMEYDLKRTAVILYSGGTSGTPKGICLSDGNMNATALQAVARLGKEVDFTETTMLSCMPCFHGFGLCINLHLMLIHGGCCILMPSFDIKSYAKNLKKKKPNLIAGVPTIFEALTHIKDLDDVKLDFLVGMFCGGDSLSIELKAKVDKFLKDHSATIQVREGYGLTECVTASCLTPHDTYKPGSIGLAFPDTTYAIVKPGTDEVLPYGEEGEIILTGPSVMLGYLDNPEETAKTLRTLADGRVWLYTGDLGYMDEEQYVYFRQRIKRMIITNGYNVYPGYVENLIDANPEVAYSCVIGVKDKRRMQRVRAYIVLAEGVKPTDELKEELKSRLEMQLAAYAIPREIIFRESLPRTLVGKVAFRLLEEEANAEAEAAEKLAAEQAKAEAEKKQSEEQAKKAPKGKKK